MTNPSFKNMLAGNKILRLLIKEKGMLLRVDWLKFIKINFFTKQVVRDKKAFLFPGRGGEIKIAKTARIYLKSNLIFHYFETDHCTTSAYLLMGEDSKLMVNGWFKIFYGSDIKVFKGAKLELGSGYCNAGTQIRCQQLITIGNRFSSARDVYIMDSDSHQLSDGNHIPNQSVCIDDDVWLGARAMILKGVVIGAGTVVAAGAVVNKNLPAHVLAAGVPARVIRENVEREL